MKKLAILILVCSTLAISCKRRTTPNKVNARVTEGAWVIGKFRDSGEIRTFDFTNVVFDFQEFKMLSVVRNFEDTFNSSWEVPENQKNPAQMILRFPETDSLLQLLHDDWNVVYLKKDEFRMERLDGQKDSTDELIFIRP